MTSSKKQPENSQFFEKIPKQLDMVCPLTFEAADKSSSQENPIPRFSMVAYTGGKMNIAGFPHPVVVDLNGLAIDRQDIPVRLDHSPRQGVGHTTGIIVVDNTVLVEGIISRETACARDVARSGIKGFPWQASIGAEVIDAEFVPHGQSITVNNQDFIGPLHVVRKALLKEVSFVDSGADVNTQAKIAAKLQENNTMEPPQKKETTTSEKVDDQVEDQTEDQTPESDTDDGVAPDNDN